MDKKSKGVVIGPSCVFPTIIGIILIYCVGYFFQPIDRIYGVIFFIIIYMLFIVLYIGLSEFGGGLKNERKKYY